jgi:hypothetical protein
LPSRCLPPTSRSAWLAATQLPPGVADTRLLPRSTELLEVARALPLALGGHRQTGFGALRYVSRDFRQKKSGPRTPRPLGPGFLSANLVRGAKGLPITCNWPFRWPLPPHQPAPGDTQGNVTWGAAPQGLAPLLLHAPFFSFLGRLRRANDGMYNPRGNAQSQAQAA